MRRSDWRVGACFLSRQKVPRASGKVYLRPLLLLLLLLRLLSCQLRALLF